MEIFHYRFWYAFVILPALIAVVPGSASDEGKLPVFGRDTVLVWKIQNRSFDSEFVVRIAQFYPDRFLEWEDTMTQGTIFMPSTDIQEAKNYVSQSLFEAGIDTRSKNATTLWLSRRIYRDLKKTGKAKCQLDNVTGSLVFLGEDQFTIQVNRFSRELPVIKVSNGRGSELWFLDQEENPLMVKHMIREFKQVLSSITTDRPNTLRWIKGKKLSNLPH
jgi:hypothetical protein